MRSSMSDFLVFFSRYPVRVTFFSSIALSLLAILGVVTIGRDAAFYLNIAQQASEQGLGVAQQHFHWPGFILLVAVTHNILGLSLELSAHLWTTLFMAGLCALLVDVVRRRSPQATWWAVLVVLAMPAFNQFRGEILREFGFWFFSVLTLWLALRWQDAGGWLRAFALPLAIAGAALFRLEAVLFFAALVLWQFPALWRRDTRARAMQLYAALGFLMLCGIAGLAFLVFALNFPATRFIYYADLISPLHLLEAFNTFSTQLADSMTYKYSRDEAGQIIFFGLLAVIVIQFFSLNGIFSAAFLALPSRQQLREAFSGFALFSWSAFLYFVVLMIFFVQEQFINARYASFLNLLLVPVVAVLMADLAGRWPRLGRAIVVLALLLMITNVVSFGAKKTHYLEAGEWIAQNVEKTASVYYGDGRIAYYAGRGYPYPTPLLDAMAKPQAFDYFLVEADGDEPWLLEWLAQNELEVLERFANRKKDTVLVIAHKR